jgi:hypothetical protein
MALQPLLARLLPTDPRYAPFGLPALRGLNVTRIAFVATLLLLVSIRRVSFFHVIKGQGPLADAVTVALEHASFEFVRLLPLLVLVTVADNLSLHSRTAVRIGAMVAATLGGAGVASFLLFVPLICLFDAFPADGACVDGLRRIVLIRTWVYDVMYAAPFVFLLHFLSRTRAAAAALHAAQIQRLDLERQMTEARLRTLRAQIEPHFLFNTLAHIQRLYQVQPVDGRRMLRNLAEYLRAALPQLRTGASTLGSEVALVRAYLNVQQIRMGRRLAFAIDAPGDLQDADLPPMMLVTLVENAIKHGLGPKREGGRVHIAARRIDAALELEVSDDGVGLPLSSGTGVGLANTRARLATLYGGAGALDIANRGGGGVSARLRLPYRRAVEAVAA